MLSIVCDRCQAKLEIAPEHAGREAVCPRCNHHFTVPDVGPGGGAPAVWRLKTPEGRTYGPVTKSQLDDWVAAGRVADDCWIVNDELGEQHGAAHYYPMLALPLAAAAVELPGSVPHSAEPAALQVKAHRGSLILGLGLVSWIGVCPVLGIAAWVLGSHDLQEMATGQRDRRGLTLTLAGQLLGSIQTLAAAAILVALAFAFLLGFIGP